MKRPHHFHGQTVELVAQGSAGVRDRLEPGPDRRPGRDDVGGPQVVTGEVRGDVADCPPWNVCDRRAVIDLADERGAAVGLVLDDRDEVDESHAPDANDMS